MSAGIIVAGWDPVKGVSVFTTGGNLYKGDTVTHYAIRGTLTRTQYNAIYHNPKHTPTAQQQSEKDYIYKCAADLYWVGECDDYFCPRGIGQFLNCATPNTPEVNNCKLVCFQKEGRWWVTVKVIASKIKVGEQLLTSYGGRQVIAKTNTSRAGPPPPT